MNETPRVLPGIHHITAITADAQKNVDFHTSVLGLRLVKLTVNFDDPSAYHLYFGDEIGHPGTVLTYFAWPGAGRGRQGTGQANALSFSIPQRGLSFWIDRFNMMKIPFKGPFARFNEEVISFSDPDGLQMELVAHSSADAREGWSDGPVPAEFAIRGFYNITLGERQHEPTVKMLTETLGFRLIGENSETLRFATGDGGAGSMVDIQAIPSDTRGIIACGSIHHVAWRTPSDEAEAAWRQSLVSNGIGVTQIIDRQYFHSIYFREPGGVLFEIATDTPGFTIDEPKNKLGSSLKLPPWMERNRQAIEHSLLPLELEKIGRKK
jgi:glyoxalase family protein